MASQITHIFYANKIIDKYFSGKTLDKTKFIIGNVFPDIRYLGVIDRDVTHVSDPTFSGLIEVENDFDKGLYAHGLMDIEREKRLKELGAYEVLEPNKFTVFAMKFLEDEFTFNLIDGWEKYTLLLDNILPEEMALVPEAAVKKWHKLLQDYFRAGPLPEAVVEFSKGLDRFDPSLIQPVMDEISRIKQNEEGMKIIKHALTSTI